MSKRTQPKATPASVDQAPPRDTVLESIIIGVEEAEKNATPSEDVYPRITLIVGGLLISGHVISVDRYLKEFFEGIGGTAKEDQADQQAKRPAAGRKNKPRNFIHLRDAKFYIPGQKPIPTEGGGVLWRGRLSCVDGFFMGVVGLRKEP